MAKVFLNNYTISDKDLLEVLNKIARHVGNVWVTSGDRKNKKPPKGSPDTSLHRLNQAVDFGIHGLTLEQGFEKLKLKKKLIFNNSSKYEVIHHGKYTNTKGPHLHIGRYSKGKGIIFKIEGISPETKGKYTIIT
ncbi:MAG: hypothetical protein AAF849_09875 [Bacteroidota bacterium]